MRHPSLSREASEESPLLGNTDGDANGRLGENDEEATINQADRASEATETPLADEPSTKKTIAILGTVWIGVFFVALDTTIVATLSAPISSDFESLSLLSWLASGYLIANSACQPLSGKLTDIFSRRTGLLFSNVFFGAGCLICGLAQREWVIILGRVVSGMGGGGLSCITTFVTSDLVPLRRRGIWQGYGNIVFGLGMGLGGVFGGWMNDWIGWRWAFLIQVPFIIVSATFVAFLVDIPVKESSESALSRVDFVGSVFLVFSLVLVLFGLNSGGNQYPWAHPLVISSIALAGALFLAFLYIEDRVASEPVIPVRLVGLNRTVLAACLANWFSTMAVFLALFYAPFYLQVRGLSSTQAGLRMVPFSIAASVGSLGAGYIMRATGRYYVIVVISVTLSIIGSALTCTFQLDTPIWATYIYFTPTGVGYGSMLTTTLVAMISAVEHKDQAVITAASYAFRSTGSTIGITIASVVFQNILTKELRHSYGDKKGSDRIIRRIRDSLDEMNHLPPGWSRNVVLNSYMEALRGAFIAGLGLAVLGGICILFMREHVLHKNLARK